MGRLTVSPANVAFSEEDGTFHGQINVTNLNNEAVIMKVKTSQPDAFIVRPHVCFIAPGSQVTVHVYTRRRRGELMELIERPRGLFMVVGFPMSPQLESQLNTKLTSEGLKHISGEGSNSVDPQNRQQDELLRRVLSSFLNDIEATHKHLMSSVKVPGTLDSGAGSQAGSPATPRERAGTSEEAFGDLFDTMPHPESLENEASKRLAKEIESAGGTPLHVAAATGSQYSIETLLLSGADTTATCSHGGLTVIPLSLAIKHRRAEAVAALLPYTPWSHPALGLPSQPHTSLQSALWSVDPVNSKATRLEDDTAAVVRSACEAVMREDARTVDPRQRWAARDALLPSLRLPRVEPMVVAITAQEPVEDIILDSRVPAGAVRAFGSWYAESAPSFAVAPSNLILLCGNPSAGQREIVQALHAIHVMSGDRGDVVTTSASKVLSGESNMPSVIPAPSRYRGATVLHISDTHVLAGPALTPGHMLSRRLLAILHAASNDFKYTVVVSGLGHGLLNDWLPYVPGLARAVSAILHVPDMEVGELAAAFAREWESKEESRKGDRVLQETALIVAHRVAHLRGREGFENSALMSRLFADACARRDRRLAREIAQITDIRAFNNTVQVVDVLGGSRAAMRDDRGAVVTLPTLRAQLAAWSSAPETKRAAARLGELDALLAANEKAEAENGKPLPLPPSLHRFLVLTPGRAVDERSDPAAHALCRAYGHILALYARLEHGRVYVVHASALQHAEAVRATLSGCSGGVCVLTGLDALTPPAAAALVEVLRGGTGEACAVLLCVSQADSDVTSVQSRHPVLTTVFTAEDALHIEEYPHDYDSARLEGGPQPAILAHVKAEAAAMRLRLTKEGEESVAACAAQRRTLAPSLPDVALVRAVLLAAKAKAVAALLQGEEGGQGVDKHLVDGLLTTERISEE